MKIIKQLFQYRFELYFFSLLCILFGSLLFPMNLYEEVMLPIFFLLNLISGTLLIYKRKLFVRLFTIIFFIIFLKEVLSKILGRTEMFFEIGGFVLFFIFYCVISVVIIEELWKTKRVDKNLIIGLMSGYLSIGLVGFFMFSAIELSHQNSFNGLLLQEGLDGKLDALMYFSYVTLLTIGYGEITPITALAQKAAILTGILGNFYTVILTAVVLEKYISASKK